jgi:hypothetical protein
VDPVERLVPRHPRSAVRVIDTIGRSIAESVADARERLTESAIQPPGRCRR